MTTPRAPKGSRHGSSPRFVIVGAGMAGVLSAIQLHNAGLTDFTVYEKADRLGGTWRENTYPGVACDVPSHLYSYSFAPNPDWSRVFSPGPEIAAYFEDVARRYGVEKYIEYDTEVSRLTFRDGGWDVETASGKKDRADFVIAATGVLHHPAYPDIAGLDQFAGPVFHSARWDHGVPLTGCRMGVVGTGSSAVQIVTAAVETVGKLTMFQRTPQWVLGVPNPPIEEEQRRLFREDPSAMQALRDELAHTFEANFANAVVDADSAEVKLLEELCVANLESNVSDPELRAKLRPSYRAACKRLIVSPGFYQAIQHPNARLVTDPIDHVEARGIRTKDGVLHELDVLVLATGFRVDRFMRPIEVTGRDGIALDQLWADRPSAYLAISIPDFPNLFMLNGPNGPVGNFSLIDVAELQFSYIMQLVDQACTNGLHLVSASASAAERFEAERVEAAKRTVWVTGCRSWYLDDRGVPAAWPWSFDRFREEMARPRMEDFELVKI
ncbi:MAG: NAD(P)/FAD-dependent oxidoreductase [Actinomycetota bacterium]|nr:NAD(P)/FAD-dependent oxidoreductase [Actinomycetota bacterium]